MHSDRQIICRLATGAAGFLLLTLTGCVSSGETTQATSGLTSGGSSTAASAAGATPTAISFTGLGRNLGSPDRPLKIILVTNGFTPFWDSMQRGMNEAAARHGISADYVGPPHAEVKEQEELMYGMAERGCNGMAVSAIEADAIAPVINDLVDHGEIVITFDSDVPMSKRLVYIGTDNYQSGREAGSAMIKLLPHGGKVWGFVGNLKAENARNREKGFLDAIRGHQIELIDVLEDQKDLNQARQNVQKVLDSGGNKVSALLGFYSYDLPAIVDVVKSAGLRKKIKIVGFDAEPVTLTALRANPPMVDATVVQKPYEFGRLSVEFLYLAHKDGAQKAKEEWNNLHPDYPLKEDRVNTGVRLVTPQNVEPFVEQLRKWKVTSS